MHLAFTCLLYPPSPCFLLHFPSIFTLPSLACYVHPQFFTLSSLPFFASIPILHFLVFCIHHHLAFLTYRSLPKLVLPSSLAPSVSPRYATAVWWHGCFIITYHEWTCNSVVFTSLVKVRGQLGHMLQELLTIKNVMFLTASNSIIWRAQSLLGQYIDVFKIASEIKSTQCWHYQNINGDPTISSHPLFSWLRSWVNSSYPIEAYWPGKPSDV